MTLVDYFFDSFRNMVPYYLALLLPIFITIAPIDPIKAAQDFTAYRLQQIDIQGIKIGSRSHIINLEAQVNTHKIRGRKCLFLKLMEVSAVSIKVAISQNAGAIIVLLPKQTDWNYEINAQISQLESDMLKEEYSIPIYFTFEDKNTIDIYENIKKIDESSSSVSAAQVLINSVISHGYQFYTQYNDGKPMSDSAIINLFGKLSGNGIEEQLPTILIVAHYDSAGIAPRLSYGYDSNGSGVVVLLQLIRVFSKLYASSKTQGKYNLVFLLSGGGKLNYIGTKKWLEEIHDHSDFISPDKISTVICLESLGRDSVLQEPTQPHYLYGHVSRPPKNNTFGYKFVQHLTSNSKPSTFQLVHKKINLNDDELRWEHERFSLKKIPAMTISSSPYSLFNTKSSILDNHVDIDLLLNNTRIIIESLGQLIYDLDNNSQQQWSSLWLNKESLEADLRFITRYPRSAQLLVTNSVDTVSSSSSGNTNNQGNRHYGTANQAIHPLLVGLERQFRHYLQAVKIGKVKADIRDPEFVLYSNTQVNVIAHRVKPAIFDFLITCFVIAYLGGVFLIINKFSYLKRFVLAFSVNSNNGGLSNGIDKMKKVM